MPEQRGDTIFNYWGKATRAYPPVREQYPGWHPLAYHCLDVAAVAASWWDASPTIQRTFLAAFGCTQLQQNKLRAWILFFTALHDLGKFDVRFQLKSPDALSAAWRPLGKEDHGISPKDIKQFDHGWAGMAWANQEYRSWLGHDDVNREIWEQWKPWLAAVTGHHGDFYEPTKIYVPQADTPIIEHDRATRQEFVSALADIFLTPEGLCFQDSPPFTSLSAQCLLAGFCAVCDWISTELMAWTNRYAPSQ